MTKLQQVKEVIWFAAENGMITVDQYERFIAVLTISPDFHTTLHSINEVIFGDQVEYYIHA